jgi:hypothetical protein
MKDDQIEISSRDYWFKVVEMLQHNWALIGGQSVEGKGVRVYFLDDNSGVFDRMDFNTKREARAGLRRNGFQRYDDDEDAQEFVTPPEPPFRRREHPNGRIYSSGEHWTDQA